jgi:hypothetical protein
MAASRTINLIMNQGEDFTYGTRIYSNTSVLVPVDIDTAVDSANAQMRKSYFHTNATATFNVHLDATNENLWIHLDSANTAAISPGRYVYDVEYLDNDGDVAVGASPPWAVSRRFRVLEGMITVTPEVSK